MNNNQGNLSRRTFLGAAAALSAAEMVGCAVKPYTAPSNGALTHPSTQLPPRGEFVVRNAYVLTMDPALGDLPTGDVHVRNGEIVAVGASLAAPGAPAIDAAGMIALPGFVDTHWHMWEGSVRGLIGDGDMDYFPVMSRIGPHFLPEDHYRGLRLGLAEAIHSGITTVHNWSHNLISGAYADAELRAMAESGIRGRFSYGYSRTLQKEPARLTDFADVARVQRDFFSARSDKLLTMGFASRGPADTPPETYRREWEAARSLGLPITQHASRSREEVARVRVIEVLWKDKLLGPDVQLVHTYQATADERKMMADTGTHVTVAPFTASRLASGFPQLAELFRAGVSVGLSVDTTTVGGNADMFVIMRLALNLHHLHAMDVLEVQPRRVLELATIDGARNLGIADRVGSLTPGKRADMILVHTTDLNTAPLSNPVNLIVQSAQPSNIDTVIIDGRILKRNRELMAIDTAQVVREATESLAAIRSRAGGP